MLTIGSLFAGIGGFELGLEWAGLGPTVWQVEKDDFCQCILTRHWPEVKRYGDIIDICKTGKLKSVDLICGGDPCPIRSKARANKPTKHPDLSGYFLTVVAQSRPQWVLRENVPAPDDKEFIAALELLGYRTTIVRINSAPFTGQNRRRDFIVGSSEEAWMCGFEKLYHRESSLWSVEKGKNTQEGYPCLTTHTYRCDARDGYIWDGRGNIRIADSDERTKLAGFPAGWLDGLSKTRVAKLTGNAVVPAASRAIGMIIRKWSERTEANAET